jgi:monoamine oxidase
MSGLMAAYHLTRAGKAVCVLEARDRVGGRALTVSEEGCPVPVELGAEFIHGGAEPTMALADATELPVDRMPDRHSRFQDGSFRDMGDIWKRYAAMFDGADGQSDESAADFLRQKQMKNGDAELFRMIVEGFEAAPVEDVSIQSLAREAKGFSGNHEQMWPTRGYGALADALKARIDPKLMELRLNTVVEEVKWRANGECTLRVREGDATHTIRTQHCIVTVPVGVLKASSESGGIVFSPEPAVLVRQLSRLAMGHAVKLVLVFREAGWMKALPDADFLHFERGNFPTLWQKHAADFRIVTAWVGGSMAKSFEPFETRDLVDQAAGQLAECCEVAPIEVREALVAAHHHDFNRDPFSRGAYPYARPGGADCQRALAEPVERALFFAGDATDSEHFGTVAGAIASGARAARQIARL